MPNASVAVGDQVYLKEGAEPFGAVRAVRAHELLVYVEDHGDVLIPGGAVKAVHDGKVIVSAALLAPDVRRAIESAHKDEDPAL